MYQRLRNRLGARTLALIIAVSLFGGGVALALPDQATAGQENAAAMAQAGKDKAAAAHENAATMAQAGKDKAAAAQENAAADAGTLDLGILQTEGPPEVVVTFLAELETWVSCIQAGAAAHAEQQSNEETRIEDDEYDDADKLALCGEKPVNPNDAEGEDLEDLDDLEEGGRPDDVGRPEDAGKPDDAGRGR
jgi:hypothetical protein